MLYKIFERLGMHNLALATPRAKVILKLEDYQKPIIEHLIKIFLYPWMQNAVKGWEGEIARRWLLPALLLKENGKQVKLSVLQENLLPKLDKTWVARKFALMIDSLTTKKEKPFPTPKTYSIDEFLKKYEVFRENFFKNKDNLITRQNVEDLIELHFVRV